MKTFNFIALNGTFGISSCKCEIFSLPSGDILYFPFIIDESRNAETIFRDKSGKRRDLDSEREEQRRKAGEKAAKDEKYAQWGKG